MKVSKDLDVPLGLRMAIAAARHAEISDVAAFCWWSSNYVNQYASMSPRPPTQNAVVQQIYAERLGLV